MEAQGTAAADGAEAAPREAATSEPDKRVDLAGTPAVPAAGASVVQQATAFRTGSFPDPVTARGPPSFGGGFVILGALVILARQVAGWNRLPGSLAPTVGAPDEPGQASSALRPFAVLGLAPARILLAGPLGLLLVAPPAPFGGAPGRAGPLSGEAEPLGPLAALARGRGLTP